MNANLAFQILQLVNQFACNHSEKPEDTVKRAELYRSFIENRGSTDDQPPVPVLNPLEPGMKRKRRTKAEMEAASMETKNSAVGIDHPRYEHIQQAMIRLFDREFGMDAVREILEGLGVKSAADLKPEQYGDCLTLLQEAIDGKPLV